ncbi:MAG: TIM barrel protein [Phaeodactylibacter sp.]|nr:TIM barrel protein [Phaeodactylibacter sp.]
MKKTRRIFLKDVGQYAAALGLLGLYPTLSGCNNNPKGAGEETEKTGEGGKTTDLFFKISLAQWSLHKSFFGPGRDGGWEAFSKALQTDPDSVLQGPLDPIDFPSIARNKFGIDAVEYVNTFYFGKAKNMDYLKELKKRCDSEGVRSLLIMCDSLGNLGDTDEAQRRQAVEKHYPWVDAAKFLGCHSIRVNAAGSGTMQEVGQAATDGLGRLSEYAAKDGINVIVENHGGYSSNADWLYDLIKSVGMENCGTLPDFGNFCIERGPDGQCTNEYDRYEGTRKLMAFAKGVSAKSHDFDEKGNEIHTDYYTMMKIVKAAGYTGYVGIEYEGSELSEEEGIIATKKLLETVGTKLS